MARFNNDDQKMLEEAYDQIQEGMWDRFKARGAEALGNVKGAAQRAAGSALSKAGDVASKGVQSVGGKIDPSNNKLAQKGQELTNSGKSAGHNAKIEYLQKNIDKRIQKFVGSIKTDIQKLGLDIGNIEMISGINDALNQLKKSSSVATPPPLPQRATPPPLPQQATQPVEDEPEDDTENPVEYSYPVKRKNKPVRKPKPVTDPRKSKVNPNRLRDRAAMPEQEERFK
jgi:hypothetical protein